jgi:hypothetical protein
LGTVYFFALERQVSNCLYGFLTSWIITASRSWHLNVILLILNLSHKGRGILESFPLP